MSGWNWGAENVKYKRLEPVHPVVWILPHHAAEEEKVLGLAILEEVRGQFSLPPLPLTFYHHGCHLLSTYDGQAQGQAVTTFS